VFVVVRRKGTGRLEALCIDWIDGRKNQATPRVVQAARGRRATCVAASSTPQVRR